MRTDLGDTNWRELTTDPRVALDFYRRNGPRGRGLSAQFYALVRELSEQLTVTALAEFAGVTVSAASRWVKEARSA